MCGLVGTAGHLAFKDEFTMKRLLLADYFRGPDSTGLAAVRTNGSVEIAKIDSNPINLFDMAKFKAVLNGNGSRVFMGHNRAATRGGVCTANAHPFQIDHITLAHNGTLDFKSITALEDAIGEKYSVDSELLCAAVAKLGIKETIELCYEGKTKDTGAWALSWYDQNEGTLNFLRNKWRSLFMAWEKNFHRLFWASEWWMIREALEGSNAGYEIHTQPSKDKNKTIGYFSFEDDIHYKFDIAELADGSDKKKRPKPVTKKISGRQHETKDSSDENFTNTMGFQFPNQRGFGTPTGNATKTKSTTTTLRGSESAKRLIQLIGDDHHPYANIIDEDKFLPLAHACGGCAWCEAPVSYGDPGVTIYERDGRLLCKTCSGYREEVTHPPSRIYLRSGEFDAIK